MLRVLFDAMYGLGGDLSWRSLGAGLYREFKAGVAVSLPVGCFAAVAYGKPLLPLLALSWWLFMFAGVAIASAVDSGVTEPGMAGVVGHSALTLVAAVALFCALWSAAGLPA